jgi:hypothetical protein
VVAKKLGKGPVLALGALAFLWLAVLSRFGHPKTWGWGVLVFYVPWSRPLKLKHQAVLDKICRSHQPQGTSLFVCSEKKDRFINQKWGIS